MKVKVTGTVKPLHDKIFVSDMDFGEQTTKSGIFIPSADGKADGITPRWGKVWAIGPKQKDVKIGEWILIDHGRWTRGVTVKQDDGSELIVRMIDSKDILVVSDDKPEIEYYRRLD